MSYSNPGLFDRNWRMHFETAYNKIRNKHFETESVEENHYQIRGSIGRRFGYHTYLTLELGYRKVSLSPPIAGETLSEDGTDHMPGLALYLSSDHRDL